MTYEQQGAATEGETPPQVDDLDLLDIRAACRLLGGTKPIDPATLYRGIRAGRYPPPVKIGAQTSRWLRSELLEAIHARMAERNSS